MTKIPRAGDETKMTDKYSMDLTTGSVGKKLFVFSMPFLISMVLQAFYSVVDMLVAGRYMGEIGTSAVNNSSIMTNFITGVAAGFALSGTVLVAQYIGAKRPEEAKSTIGTLFSIFIIGAVVITVFGIIFSGNILSFLNTPAEAVREAQRYLIICFAGTIFICGYNAVSSVLKGLGDSRRPLYFVIFATILNVGLDILFVGPMQMGAAGAALATIIAQASSFFLAVHTLKRSDFIFDFKKESFVIDRDKLIKIIKIGIPSAIQSTAVNLSIIFVTSNVNQYGLVASAAVGVCGKVDSFAILPNVAMNQAVASMAGQNLGAQKYDRVSRTTNIGILINLAFSFAIFLIVRTFCTEIVGLFNCKEDGMAIAQVYMSIVTYSYLFNAYTFVMNGLATGSGNSMFALLNTFINMILARLPLMYYFETHRGMGLVGIFWAMGFSQVFGCLAGFLFYVSKKWRKSLVNPESGKNSAEKNS